jgi:PAS domain S-box-containing protein
MSQEAVRFLIENVPAALFTYRQRLDGSNAVDYLSPACLSIWEIPNEVVQKDSQVLWQMVHPDEIQNMQNSVLKSAQELSLWDWKWRNIMPNGQIKWLHGRGFPRREVNGDVVWFTFILDITQEKNLEQTSAQLQLALMETQKYEAAANLAAGFAHDINNYLAVISASVGLIKLNVELNEKGIDLIKSCQNAIRESTQLTRSLLDFVRNRKEYDEWVDVKLSLEALTPLILAALPNDIKFNFKFTTSGCRFMGQVSIFQSAIMNLILNARDALNGSGEIYLNVTNQKNELILVVQDTGRGMSDFELKKCRDPFYTTKENQKGTGLGLYMVDQFVKKMSGQLMIESELNKGTRIEIRFPLSVGH